MKLAIVAVLILGLCVSRTESCRRVSAALSSNGQANLFFGNYYITLNDNYIQEYGEDHTPEDWMVFFPDAAITFSVDQQEYFFSGNFYFTEASGFAPESTSKFGDFFKDGIDAAANLNGSSVFFKDCSYVETLPSGKFSEPKHVPSGLPCKLDAALTEGKSIVAFKDDQLFVIEPNWTVEEALPYYLMMDISYTALCQKGEDAEPDEE